MPKVNHNTTVLNQTAGSTEVQRQQTLLKTGALQSAIFNSANFSSIATDAQGVIQISNRDSLSGTTPAPRCPLSACSAGEGL